jgi:PHD/YefM family antitoxin component YafN of YafNO toxin-antitoxin module
MDNMTQDAVRNVSATQAKQAFGELLAAAAHAPVGIEKHGKVRAVLVSAEFFSRAGPDAIDLAERRAARVAQALVEKERLIKHQRIAIDLLTLPDQGRQAAMARALGVVARWRSGGLCSLDYIEKWEAWLSLPLPELAKAMTSDAGGWGPALRQNSPWTAEGQ